MSAQKTDRQKRMDEAYFASFDRAAIHPKTTLTRKEIIIMFVVYGIAFYALYYVHILHL
jgi:hypothetical protein